MPFRTMPLAALCAAMLTATSFAGITWHVDDDAPDDPGPGDPTVSDPLENGSLAHPFDSLQEAIGIAADGETVLVLDGTYTGPGNVDLSYGGALFTVQSQNGSAVTIIDAQGSGARGFIFDTGETTAAVLEGFSITGVAIAGSDGGAIRCIDTSPSINDCRLHGNSVTGTGASGAGFYSSGGEPQLTGCVIEDNIATDISGGPAADQGTATGGGLRTGDVDIDECIVRNNLAEGGAIGRGGGLASVGVATLSDCTFEGNTAMANPTSGSAFGGGVYIVGGPSVFVDTTFDGNVTDADATLGGAIYTKGGSADIDLLRCTISDNVAAEGSGVRAITGAEIVAYRCSFTNNSADGARTSDPSNFISCLFAGHVIGLAHLGGGVVTSTTLSSNQLGLEVGSAGSSNVRNCILWGNTSNTIVGSGVTASYNIIEGGFTGTANLDADPLFVNPAILDFRLAPGSPAIDAGNNSALPPWAVQDLVGDDRYVDDPSTADTGVGAAPIVDFGCREYPGFFLAGDTTGDGIVDVADLVSVIKNWGPCPGSPCPGDVDLDGVVNVNDLVSVLENWGNNDCNFNGISDSLEGSDCNGNSRLDECDIALGLSQDCQEDGVPDECQLDGNDLNGNSIPDDCDPDCNRNGVPDDLDISGGSSADLDGSGVPDECESPAAEACVAPAILTTGVPQVFTTNFSATNGFDEDCFDGSGTILRDVWFRWTATCDGTATVDLCGSLFNTRVAIYTTCPTGPDSAIACGDDECGLQSSVSFAAVAGTVYRFRAGAPFDTGGSGIIVVTCE